MPYVCAQFWYSLSRATELPSSLLQVCCSAPSPERPAATARDGPSASSDLLCGDFSSLVFSQLPTDLQQILKVEKRGVCAYVHARIRVCMCACMHACVRVCMHACVCTYMRACVRAYVCARVRVCVHA